MSRSSGTFQKGHNYHNQKEEVTKKISDKAKERLKNPKNNPMYNKKHSKKTKQKIRLKTLEQFKNGMPKETKEKISNSLKGENNPMYKIRHKKETRLKISKTREQRYKENKIIRLKLDKNPSWKGGLSFEPYGIEFNNDLKQAIKKRDNYKCKECNQSSKYPLEIHHINYNKKNNNSNNLITLCKVCHARTGINRGIWENYFKNKIGEKE